MEQWISQLYEGGEVFGTMELSIEGRIEML